MMKNGTSHNINDNNDAYMPYNPMRLVLFRSNPVTTVHPFIIHASTHAMSYRPTDTLLTHHSSMPWLCLALTMPYYMVKPPSN